jgi:hypothetical protein
MLKNGPGGVYRERDFARLNLHLPACGIPASRSLAEGRTLFEQPISDVFPNI